jgi:hypothetical protein
VEREGKNEESCGKEVSGREMEKLIAVPGKGNHGYANDEIDLTSLGSAPIAFHTKISK